MSATISNPNIASGGTTITDSFTRTGSSIKFDGNSTYNTFETPLNGDFTIDKTDSVHLGTATLYILKDSDPLIDGDYILLGGSHRNDKVNVYFLYYDRGDDNVYLKISQDSRPLLADPQFTSVQSSETSILITITQVTPQANSYELFIGELSDRTDAVLVDGYNGTDLSFDISSLVTGITYYLFLRAAGSNNIFSRYVVQSLTLQAAIVPLLEERFNGNTLDTNIWNNTTDGSTVLAVVNNELRLVDQATGSLSSSKGINSSGKFSFDITTNKYVTFNVNRPSTETGFNVLFIDPNDTNQRLEIYDRPNNGNNNLSAAPRINGVFGTEETTTDSINGRLKISFESGIARLFKWNGTTYAQLLDITITITDYAIFFLRVTSSVNGENTVIDDLIVTDTDWSGELPNI